MRFRKSLNAFLMLPYHVACANSKHQIIIYNHKFNRKHTLKGHTEEIVCIIQLQDGRLASCGKDAMIKFWDLTKENSCISWDGHPFGGTVWCLLQLRDGRLLSGSTHRFIRVWNLSDGSFIEWETGCAIFCLIQLYGGKIVSADAGGCVLIWTLQGTRERTIIIGNSVWSLIQIANGLLVCGLSQDHFETIDVYDLNSNSQQKYGGEGSTYSLLSYQNGFVSGSTRSKIDIWTPNGENFQLEKRFEQHLTYQYIHSLCELPDGRLLATSDKICIWNVKQKRKKKQCRFICEGKYAKIVYLHNDDKESVTVLHDYLIDFLPQRDVHSLVYAYIKMKSYVSFLHSQSNLYLQLESPDIRNEILIGQLIQVALPFVLALLQFLFRQVVLDTCDAITENRNVPRQYRSIRFQKRCRHPVAVLVGRRR